MINKFNMSSIISLFFGVIILLGGCTNMEPPIPGANEEISIMSFNIRFDTEEDDDNKWDNRKEACVEMLEEKQPSVFGIQEGLRNQVNYFSENLDDYDWIGVGREDGHSDGEYNAVFYLKNQFDLLDHNTFWLSETPKEATYGWDAACKRIVTWVHLQNVETDKTFYVFNTHFDHEGKEARKESAQLLVEKINEITDSTSTIFISGDFNALISNSIFNPILDEFYYARRTAVESDHKDTFNFWGKFFGIKIDFIFYRQAEAKIFETVNDNYGVDYISDHYPVMGTFKY